MRGRSPKKCTEFSSEGRNFDFAVLKRVCTEPTLEHDRLFCQHYQYEPVGGAFAPVWSVVSEKPSMTEPKCNNKGFPESYLGQK